jgi:hypothetical protein
MLKEHLVDAIDELVSVSNRHRINSLLQKFDTKVTKVCFMMQRTQKHLVTAHTDCVNTIRDVLSRQDKGCVDDSTTIHDEGNDAQGQVVNYNVQQTTNAAIEALLHRDQVFNNRNQYEKDQSDTQHADDTAQQTSNVAVDAQAWVVDDNMQETTSAAMEDPLHHDQVLNNRNQDEHDEPDAQHAEDTIDQISNTARNASCPNDQGTERMKLPIESQRPHVSAASPLSPSSS